MKTILKVLAVLVLLVVLAVAALLFLFDPNALKPRIESMARDQGVALSIRGPLGWQFWPSIGIEINDVTVAHVDTPEAVLAELDSASLLVATRPLLQRQLQVEHVYVKGARANLQVDAQGTGNWEVFLPDAETPQELSAALEDRARAEYEASQQAAASAAEGDTAAQEDDQGFSLAVADITFSDVVLNYKDASSDTALGAELRHLQLTDVNLEGRPIAVQLQWRASLQDGANYQQQPLIISGATKTRVSVAEDFGTISIPPSTLELTLGSAEEQTTLQLELEAQVSLLETGPAYSGKLALKPFNLKQLLRGLQIPPPETSREEALTQLSFKTAYTGTANSLSLFELELQLDGTRFNGEIAVTDFERQALVVTLMGDALNADDYLPPATEEAPAEAATDEPLIPLETVRALEAQVRLNLGSLIFSDLTFSNLRLRLNATGGVVDISEASADAYEGKLNSRARLDARGETAHMDFNAQMQGFQLAPVLRDLELDERIQFAGSLQLDAQGRTRGVTLEEIMQAMVLDATFDGKDVTMAPLNVEKYFCQAVSLMRDEEVEQGEQPAEQKVWPEQTRMQPLAGRVRMINEVITVESFDASVEALVFGLRGQVNLAQETYDLHLPLRLSEKTTSEDGCTVKSNYWLDRSLELLRCRGSLADVKLLSDCGINNRGLEEMAKEYAGQKLQKELLRHLGDDEADAEGGEKDVKQQAVEGLLRHLLRPKNEDTQTQPDME